MHPAVVATAMTALVAVARQTRFHPRYATWWK